MSEKGKLSVIPDEIKGWNWGAFFLTWIWGLRNGTYIAFLVVLPIFNWIWPFVLGARGNEWAWQNETWESIEHFKKTQRKWAIWGACIVLPILVPLLFVFLFFGIPFILR